MASSEKRTFTVDPHIIYSLIQAQAGTLAKAVLECVMNGFDAAAKSMDITVTQSSIVIVDTGFGFRSRAEIEECFETFGFKHEPGQRAYGQFGIGRAQLWNFCNTVWRTNNFSMDVDIKNKGLDYDLKENMPQHDGLTITGKFYEKLKTSELLAFERELSELAMYVSIPVTLNGKLISKDPALEKWTHETPDAYVRIRENGELTVYNLGVKVKDYNAYMHGTAGVVVTKPGVRLALNMARNDILVSECKVWKRIKPFLQAKTDERIKRKSAKLSEHEIQNLVHRVLSGEAEYSEVQDRKLITDIQGKNYTIHEFVSSIRKERPCTVAPRGTGIAEKANILKYGFVLSPVTLTRFKVNTPKELGAALREYFVDTLNYQNGYLADNEFVDDYRDVCKDINDLHTELPEKDHLKEERVLLAALRHTQPFLLYAMNAAGVIEGSAAGCRNERALTIGESETSLAWTNGSSRIVLERKHVKKAKNGLPGIMAIANTMAHEYLHEGATTGTHEHDLEFYERLERVTKTEMYGEFVVNLFREYIKEQGRRSVKIFSRTVNHADLLDKVDDFLAPPTPVEDEEEEGATLKAA